MKKLIFIIMLAITVSTCKELANKCRGETINANIRVQCTMAEMTCISQASGLAV